ncbi:MAG: hypothetical protein EB078_08525 [Proteobacteria bacterium]|nr:hypothetical protein [Pseudomonadota bacterium]NDC24615.1 hypothetical protein [Pseudomonadota bacterium]NDD04937.1 hypothetical protein [Pseudomonadota bacterium]NDG26072.1 hypothetical protein [Pseudomonadota bacterium]
MKKRAVIYGIVFSVTLPGMSLSAGLTKSEIFFRCYSQLTDRRLPANDRRISNIKLGTLDPIIACMDLLKSAEFGLDGQIPNPTDPTKYEAKLVLRRMHKLHTSFFLLEDYNENGRPLTRDMYDIETAAYYFTRALFQAHSDFTSVVTATKHLRAIRSIQSPPTGSAFGVAREKVAFGDKEVYTPRGELWGIQEIDTLPLGESNTNPPASLDLATHFGGGIIGSNPYLYAVQARNEAIVSNGGLRMHRGFSKAIMNDFLCREFPVVEERDVVQFVTPASSLAFRQSKSCNQCHASMDQLASVLRNMSYIGYQAKTLPTHVQPGFETAYFLRKFNTTDPVVSGWPAEPNNRHHVTPTTGRLFYRDSSNRLVDQPIDSLTSLGLALRDQFDFYLCTASRYYAHFTGVKIKIVPGLIGTSGPNNRLVNQAQYPHVKNIHDLAKTLQSKKSIPVLIESILKLPEYQKSDFGVSGP